MDKIWNLLYTVLVITTYTLLFLWWAYNSQPEDKREHNVTESEVVEINKVNPDNTEKTI